ncbi:MAG: prolipoprotein diacylglyceryl transferase [Clostridia bacterium]|nr:prolipoprotein diacylglyceryl transferase [Clostridia bacterium]
MLENNIPGYLVMMAVSALLCGAVAALSARKEASFPAGRAVGFGAAFVALGAVLGLLGAKTLYCLFMLNHLYHMGLGAFWTGLKVEELSYYGGVAGVCLAMWLTGKAFGLKARRAMNLLVPAAALMAALARFAEYFLGLLGTGMYLEESFFPVAVAVSWGDWTEYYLAVFMLEGLLSLVAFVLSLVHRGERCRFLRTLFYLCLPQVFCESLRDSGIKWLFVKPEQLACFLACVGILFWYCLTCGEKGWKRFWPALACVPAAGLIVALEFALDGKIPGIPVPAAYAVMIAVLAGLAVIEHIAVKRCGGTVRE